jgi:hypothetical protein
MYNIVRTNFNEEKLIEDLKLWTFMKMGVKWLVPGTNKEACRKNSHFIKKIQTLFHQRIKQIVS